MAVFQKRSLMKSVSMTPSAGVYSRAASTTHNMVGCQNPCPVWGTRTIFRGHSFENLSHGNALAVHRRLLISLCGMAMLQQVCKSPLSVVNNTPQTLRYSQFSVQPWRSRGGGVCDKESLWFLGSFRLWLLSQIEYMFRV